MRDEWYDNSGSLGEVGSLDAVNRNEGSSGRFARDAPREARPHGDLAAEALANAISEVEGKMAGLLPASWISLAPRPVDSHPLSEILPKIRKSQARQGETLKDEQDELNERAKELLEKIDQAAGLGDFNENATEDLMKGAGIPVRTVGSAPAREPPILFFTKHSLKPSARRIKWPGIWKSLMMN